MDTFQYAIVLTGGIATGKSTVASLLKLHGFKIIDADKISHQILDENIENIKNIFGNKYIKENKVNRRLLGDLIFNNQNKKKELEELLHPQIKKIIIQESIKMDKFKIPYLIEIPLFFETKNYNIDKVLVVYTTKEIQIERLKKRDNFSRDYALKIADSQMNIEDKKNSGNYLIDNSKDLKFLQEEVEKVIKEIKNDYL